MVVRVSSCYAFDLQIVSDIYHKNKNKKKKRKTRSHIKVSEDLFSAFF